MVDTGSKRYVHGADSRRCAATDACRLDDGFELPRPYPRDVKWSPTAVTVDERGAIWVADGYGQSLVHRYTADGELDLTLDDGFATPHCVTAVGDALLVCDRANGASRSTTSTGTTADARAGRRRHPTDLIAVGDELVLTDFTAARVTVLTRDGELVGTSARRPLGRGGRLAECSRRDGDSSGRRSSPACSTARTPSPPIPTAASTSPNG